MINLFNIPSYNIDTSKFNHYLHGNIVDEFETTFKNYVGAKYACSVNSATNAIFLSLLNKGSIISVPSMIPPVVLNAILTSGNRIKFIDNINWVGDSYVLHDFGDYKIIDSAQKVDRNQFVDEANDNDLMIFSFYPTKPVGSMDGGMVVSNDWNKIRWFKEAVMNGMSYAKNNWERSIKFPGYKMYMNSMQCTIALENLKRLDNKTAKLKEVRDIYNKELGYNNTSDHLYRIEVADNKSFIEKLKHKNIISGIHYTAMHEERVYEQTIHVDPILSECPLSEVAQYHTVSIPFHECLTDKDISYIIKSIKQCNA